MDKLQIVYSSIEALGSIATVLSVIWAIKVYKTANEEKDYLETKDNIMKTLDKRLNSLSQDCDQSQSCDSLHVFNIAPKFLNSLL